MNTIKETLWKTELEIMDVIHSVCLENNLRYSLAYGTLLGAVRHKGFIPWDDDIDIIMPRDDYEKLIHIWKAKAPASYILQEPYNSPDLANNFAKIRKDHTTFIQYEFEKERDYHKGIFVDVFPFDRAASGKISSKVQKTFCFLAMLFNRGYTSKKGGIREIGEKVLLCAVPQKKHRVIELWAEKNATKWNNDRSLKWFGFQTVADMRHHYAPDAFDQLIEIEFENRKYRAFNCYEDILKEEFGDYMQLPSEEERVWKHHPLIIDFEHNYEELKVSNNE